MLQLASQENSKENLGQNRVGQNDARPPYSNTGYMVSVGGVEIPVRPDWFRASFRENALSWNLIRYGVNLYKRFKKTILGGQNIAGWAIKPGAKGKNGFKHAVILSFNGEERASLQWGGKSQNGWVMLELRGALCALLRRPDWISLYRMMLKKGGRLGRFDLAADDKAGAVLDVFQCRFDHDDRPAKFIPRSRLCKGGWLPGSTWMEKNGATLYVGEKDAPLMYRIYQKGRQLGSSDHPQWVRWETQWMRAGGRKELDIGMIHPDNWVSALLGSCIYLADKFNAAGATFTFPHINPIEEPREVAAKGLCSLFNQYGVTIAAYVELMGSEAFLWAVMRKGKHPVLSQLTRFDVPAILEMQVSLRDGGPASGSGALVSASSDVLEW